MSPSAVLAEKEGEVTVTAYFKPDDLLGYPYESADVIAARSRGAACSVAGRLLEVPCCCCSAPSKAFEGHRR